MIDLLTILSIDRDWLLTANLLLSVLLLLWVLRYKVLYRKSSEQARQFRKSLEELNEGFYRAKTDGNVVYANPMMTKLMGFEDSEELSQADNEKIESWYREPERRKQFLEKLNKDGVVRNFISETRNFKTGERIWVTEDAHLVCAEGDSNPRYYEGLMLNITDAVERGMLEDRIEKLSDNLPGGLFQMQVDKNGDFAFEYASKGFQKLTGMSREDLANNKAFLQRVVKAYHSRFYHTLSKALQDMSAWNVEFKFIDDGGEVFWVGITATPERRDDGTMVLHGHIRDISERKEAESKIAYYAYYDMLTGLPNRTFFMHHLDKAIKCAARDRVYKAVLFMDIDNFKQLNDNFGHAVGDLLLKNVGKRIEKAIRANDTVARFGGDEFVMLLEGVGHDKAEANRNARAVANKVLEEFKKGFVLNDTMHNCTTSIGVCTFIGENTDAEQMIKNADSAMYKAKNSGKNMISLFDGPNPKPLASPNPLKISDEATEVRSVVRA